jgi:hypothetical protein
MEDTEIQKSPAQIALEQFCLLVHLYREMERKGYLDVSKRIAVGELTVNIAGYLADVIRNETPEVREAANV